jgi:hypothetical protein
VGGGEERRVGCGTFRSFAKAEMNDILARDAEDDAKLAKGIRRAGSCVE